jgi:hypothetical protein
MPLTEWKIGDRVVHGTRSEWGIGEVRSAERVTQEGKPCQRLTIRFERAGVKVLTTAFADLRPATHIPTQEPEEPALVDAAAADLQARLVQLPEDAADPFRTRKSRLEFTLSLYRFNGAGGSLLDWAASQTGLKDPLSRFSRHELEHLFDRFRANLDAHLRKLAAELRKEDPAALASVVAAAGPEGKQALKRTDALR